MVIMEVGITLLTADVLIDGSWWHFNDDNSPRKLENISKDAYMAFYVRVDDSSSSIDSLHAALPVNLSDLPEPGEIVLPPAYPGRVSNNNDIYQPSDMDVDNDRDDSDFGGGDRKKKAKKIKGKKGTTSTKKKKKKKKKVSISKQAISFVHMNIVTHIDISFSLLPYLLSSHCPRPHQQILWTVERGQANVNEILLVVVVI